MKRKLFFALWILLFFGFISINCSAQSSTTGIFIGIALPSPETSRWTRDGNILKTEAERRGFRVEIQWATNNQTLQNQQIKSFLDRGAKALIIGESAAYYGDAGLTSLLSEAARKKVPVISYDRFIKNADYDYYITYNFFRVGALQAQSIVYELDLENISSTNPKYITLFAGSPTDISANRFYDGAMDVLNTYIDRGVLKVIGPYPRTSADTTNYQRITTENWYAPIARTRMENLLRTDANNVTLDAILAPNDQIARAVIEACKSNSRYRNKFPVICGLDAEFESAVSIKNGEQYSTVFMDTSKLAESAIILTEQILMGQDPFVPGAILATGDLAQNYHNGKRLVKAYLLDPVLITKNNLEILIQSGIFNSEQTRLLSN